jgi:hypothetical protein
MHTSDYNYIVAILLYGSFFVCFLIIYFAGAAESTVSEFYGKANDCDVVAWPICLFMFFMAIQMIAYFFIPTAHWESISGKSLISVILCSAVVSWYLTVKGIRMAIGLKYPGTVFDGRYTATIKSLGERRIWRLRPKQSYGA